MLAFNALGGDAAVTTLTLTLSPTPTLTLTLTLTLTEALFTRFAHEGADSLDDAQAQQALQFLTPRPKDGGPKPAVHFAAPAGAYTASGELRLPKSWFMMLLRTMA